MGLVTKDDGWRLADEVWEQIEPLLPPRKPHPLGCHNPRVADRDAMNAILFVLRTGCQWNPTGAAAALLTIVEKEPDAALRALH